MNCICMGRKNDNWIIGNTEFSMTGTSLIKWAVFADGNFDVKVGGDANLEYNPAYIYNAITNIGEPETNVPQMIAWTEI
jgi:hypothetical protein